MTLPPDEIAQLMRFIAKKTKSVKSPMNVRELSRQFKEKTGSSMAVKTLAVRINTQRLKIHGMTEFDTETKVKMLFALSAPIDAGFLKKLKEVANVEMDEQQRIIRYNQKDGGLGLSGKHLRVPMKLGEQLDREMILFLAEKSKASANPIADKALLREFKETKGYTDSIDTLKHRYRRVKETIYQSTGIDRNRKIKMMFISNAKLAKETLREIRKDADVEVDEEGRITKYKSKNGSLELEGNHGLSTSMKSVFSDRWQKIYQKANENESEEEDDKDTKCQTDYEKKRIELVRFLIESTKNASSSLSIKQLGNDYKKEFKNSDPLNSTITRIKSFRQHISKMNHFDTSTKVRMLFALSAPIDADFLKELRRDAVVELDEKMRIKKYKANDGSLDLEGDHSHSAKVKTTMASVKNTKVLNALSEWSEEDESEKENADGSIRSNHFLSSSSARNPQKSNRKRQLPEKDSDVSQTRNQRLMSPERKRVRISYSSSEASENESSDEKNESVLSGDDAQMYSDTNNVDNERDDNYEDDMENIPVERNPEEEEILPEGPSTSVKDLLILLRGLGISVKSPTMNGLLKKIESKIENLGNGNQQVPLENIGILLNLCLVMLMDHAPPECPPEEKSTSLRDFLIAFKVASCHINHQSIDSFHQKLKEIIQELAVQDKKIPVELVHRALNGTLNIIGQ